MRAAFRNLTKSKELRELTIYHVLFTGKRICAVVDPYTVFSSLALHSLPSLHVQKKKSVLFEGV